MNPDMSTHRPEDSRPLSNGISARRDDRDDAVRVQADQGSPAQNDRAHDTIRGGGEAPSLDAGQQESPIEDEGGFAQAEEDSGRNPIWEYLGTFVIAIIVAVLIKTFLIQPFFIPSTSMAPTLQVDDKIIVSKLHPGVLDIERGDIIVFEDPHDWIPGSALDNPGPRVRLAQVLSVIGLVPDPAQDHLVKRVIGLPGDHVVCAEVGGDLSINGTVIDEPFVNREGGGACQTTFDVHVPAGNLWVLGDNRFMSADSSIHNAMDGRSGFVPTSRVTGKAVAVFWPIARWQTLMDGRDAFADVPDPS